MMAVEADDGTIVASYVADGNVRLIAAAPDLLEALQRLAQTVAAAIRAEDWKVDGACDPDRDMSRARAAIAKATSLTGEA